VESVFLDWPDLCRGYPSIGETKLLDSTADAYIFPPRRPQVRTPSVNLKRTKLERVRIEKWRLPPREISAHATERRSPRSETLQLTPAAYPEHLTRDPRALDSSKIY
jgi:hypothetical protein